MTDSAVKKAKGLGSRMTGIRSRFSKQLMTGSLIFVSNLRNRNNPLNLDYHLLIKNCQAIQKSFIDRKSNAWFTLGHGFHREFSRGKLALWGSPLRFLSLKRLENVFVRGVRIILFIMEKSFKLDAAKKFFNILLNREFVKFFRYRLSIYIGFPTQRNPSSVRD